MPITGQKGRLESAPFQYFSVLWRRRNIIILAVSAMLLVAFVYLIYAPTRYTATTAMVLDTRRASVVQSEIFIEPQIDEAAVESHVVTIKSANVAAIVIKKLKLAEDAEFAGPPTLLEKLFDTRPADKTADQHEETLRTAIERFEKGLRVTRTSLRSYAVEIAYTSLDPKKAATIANATAEAYIEDQLQGKFEIAKRASGWLRQRISELRTQATEAFKAVQDFKSQNNLIVSSDGKLATDVELEQLTESLGKGRGETVLAKSRLAEIEAVLSTQNSDNALPDGTVTDALRSPVITKLRQHYLDDKKRAIEWASRYGPNHQTVEDLRAGMANLKREIREEMQRIAETYKSDLKVARSREETIEKKVIEVFQNNSENRQSQVKLQELESAANTYRSTYKNFLSRYTQAVQQQSFPSAEARIITFASVGKKTSPRIALAVGLAIVGGFAFGAAAALVKHRTDRIIYARDQLIGERDVTCLAILPVPERPNKVLRGVRIFAKQKKAESPRVLYNEAEPFSTTSEALRNIKVAIDHRSISHETRALAIVSALPGEGKSSVAASLAATIAKAGRKVLMIDSDFRNPSLTKFFDLQSRAGVVELICGQANVADIMFHNLEYGFDFLCGSTRVRPVNTADLLNSEAMSKLLAAAKEDYDYVIVDLPPILPVIDVHACAHLFDAFALVVEWGRTSIDDLDNAFGAAPLVQERLLGVVLNKVDAEAMRRIEGYKYAAHGYYV